MFPYPILLLLCVAKPKPLRLIGSLVLQTARPEFKQVFQDDGQSFLAGWQGDRMVLKKGPRFFAQFPVQEDGFAKLGGETWIIGSHCRGSTCVIAGYKDSARLRAVWALVTMIFLPLLAIFGLAVVGMRAAIGSGLRPLNVLASAVRDRSEDDLSALDQGHTPIEARPLVDAINQLVVDLRGQLQTERNFLNTCAHELRTPVAGLIAQIQSLDAMDPAAASELGKVSDCARRVSRTADQILTLAQTTNARRLKDGEDRFDLVEMLRRMLADTVLPHKGIQCSLTGLDSLWVTCNPLAVEIMVRNLLDNAVSHGVGRGETGQIAVSCVACRDAIAVVVENSGTPIDPAETERFFERFYRSSKTQAGGAGLGLPIVRDIARLYGGDITIEPSSSLSGAMARLLLPTTLAAN